MYLFWNEKLDSLRYGTQTVIKQINRFLVWPELFQLLNPHCLLTSLGSCHVFASVLNPKWGPANSKKENVMLFQVGGVLVE